MLIILEGLDRTGKSSLAADLQALTGAEIWHASKPEDHPLAVYEAKVDDRYDPAAVDIDGLARALIVDRWHVGELVWPVVFGRASDYDQEMFLHTEMFLASRGAVLVYCERRDIAAHLAELVAHNEPIASKTSYLTAASQYQAALGNVMCTTLTYDRATDNNLHHELLNVASAAREAVLPIYDVTAEWIGAPKPEVLLVGERFGPAHGKKPAAAVPFVPYRGTSGHFLMRELAHSDLWRRVAIVNSIESTGEPADFDSILNALGRPPVVALGNNASKELRRQRITHGQVPHPQYVRRFERRRGDGWYHGLLCEAITAVS